MSTQERDLAFEAFLQKKGELDYRTKDLRLEQGKWPKVIDEPFDLRKELDDQFLDYLEIFKQERFPGRPLRDKRLVYLDAGDREEEFQKWYAKWADIAGISPDPNPDLHKYDYRKAFLAGVEPTPDKTGEYHWPSRYKYHKELEGEDHPARYVDGKDTAPLGVWEKVVVDRLRAEKGPPPGPTIGAPSNRPPIPQSVMDSPTLPEFRSRATSFLKQSEDAVKWAAKNPASFIQGGMDALLTKFFKGITFGAIDLDEWSAWIGQELGIPARTAATREQWIKEDLGYVPRKPLEAAESLAEASGALAGYGAVLGAFAPLTAGIQVPVLRVLARGAVNGVLASILQTPEGDDSVVERAKQIPGNVLFFTLLDAGILTASKIAEIIKWNRQYASVAEEAGWVRYEKFEPVTVPGQRAEFTAKQVRSLFNKMQRNAAGENIPLTAEEQAAINDLNRPLVDPSLRPRGEATSGGVGNGWTQAVKQGWIGPVGTEGWFRGTKYTPVGFPRQPEINDIFRATPRPNPPMATGPRTVWSAETGAPPPAPEAAPQRGLGLAAAPGVAGPPPAGEPPPPGPPPTPTPTDIVVRPPIVTPPPPTAAPKEIPGLPPAPFARRRAENAETRRVIDAAIADFRTPGGAAPEDLDLARGALEHPEIPDVGVERLSEIQESLGVYKYYALFNVDPANFPEVTDQANLDAFNFADNPLKWRLSFVGSTLQEPQFLLQGNSPAELQREIADLGIDKQDVGFGASIDEADENLYKTQRALGVAGKGELFEDIAPGKAPTPAPEAAQQPIYHWTQPENIEKIFDQGFNTKLPALFGFGLTPGPQGVQGLTPASKPARGTLYFTRDPNRYQKADVFVGQGKGNKDFRYFDREKRVWKTIPLALRTTELKSIEAYLKPDAKVLVLDSIGKYLNFRPIGVKLRGSLPHIVKKAKNEKWDALEVKHVPGQWEMEGWVDHLTGDKDMFWSTVGAGGEDDFFIFNRKAIKIPEQLKYRNRKLFYALAKASQKRGLVGWPKGKKKIWDDIFKITNGTGMKPDISPTTRRVSAEFSENVPKFMWNSKSAYTYDIVEQELRDNYGYNFEKDDIFSQLQQAEKDRFGEEEVETYEPTEDEVRRSIENQVQPLMNEGEDLEAFFDRMEGEARETGWGDDVNGYIDQQLEIKKKPIEPAGGEEPPEFFKLESKFTARDIRAELSGTLSESILERMRNPNVSDLPKYVSEQLPSARIFDQSIRDDIDQKLALANLDPTDDTFVDVLNWLTDVVVWKSRADFFLAEEYFWSDASGKSPINNTVVSRQVADEAKPEDGPDYLPTLPGQKRRATYGVDKIRAWFNEGKLKYPSTSYIGDVSVRELLQNGLDAVIEALEKGQIKEGIITLKYHDNYIFFTDNGIGMSDADIADRFLMLHATGKSKMGRFGGMGIAKAVILAPDPTASWTLHTRDNWFTSEMANREDVIGTKKNIQGTRIYVKTDAKITSELAEIYIKTTKLPDKVSVIIEKGLGIEGKRKGPVFGMMSGFDLFVGMTSENSRSVVSGNDIELNYYPIPELKKKDLYDLLNKKVIYRIVDEKTGARLTQFVQDHAYGKFTGCLVADITSKYPAGDVKYPFTDSRMSLKWDMNDPIDKVKERFIVDPGQAMRAGVVKLPPKPLVDLSPQWKRIIEGIDKNPAYKRLIKVIKEIYEETNHYTRGRTIPTIPFQDIRDYTATVDAGYDAAKEGFSESTYNALCAVAYDATLRLICGEMGIDYVGSHFIFSETIEGMVAASTWRAGEVGYNPSCFGDRSAGKSPKHLAEYMFDTATHEAGHHKFPHGQEFDKYVDMIREISWKHKHLILDLSEAIHGKLDPTRFMVRSWANVKLPSGRVAKVEKNNLDMLGPKQLDLILDTEETHEPRGIYEPEPGEQGKTVRRPGREEGLPERGRDRLDIGLPGETVGPVDRGRAQLPGAPGYAPPDKEGLGIRKGEPGEPELEHFRLTRKSPFGGPLFTRTPVEPEKPAEVTTPRQVELDTEFGLKPQVEKPKLPAKVVEAPKRLPMDVVQKEVVRLTSGKNFPRHWQGNTQTEIEDNRQNMIVYVTEHYDPAKGQLENFINNAKQYFYRGEMPRGQKAVATAMRKTEIQVPEVSLERGKAEIEVPTEASAFAPEGRAVYKREVEPEAPEARELRHAREARKVDAIYRQVAKLAVSDPRQQALFSGEEMPKPELENVYYEILRSRLTDEPEPYEQLGPRLGIGKSLAQELFEDKLLPKLRNHPAVIKMVQDQLRVKTPEDKTREAGFIDIPSGAQIKEWYERWFTSARGNIHFVDRRNDMRIGRFHAEVFGGTIGAARLQKWLKKQPFATREHIIRLMTGDISGTTGYVDIISDPNVPNDIKDVLLELRRRIDLLSNLILMYGANPQSVEMTIRDNTGKYLERKYRAWDKKRWKPKASDRALLKYQLMNPVPGTHAPMTADEADTFMDAKLAFIRAVGTEPDWDKRNKLIDQDNFIRRQDLSVAWRRFLGEYRDPAWLTVDTITRQATQVANARMLDEIANYFGENTPQNPGGIWTKDPERARTFINAQGKPETWVFQFADQTQFGKLRGAYVPEDLYQWIVHDLSPVRSDFERFIATFITNPYKWIRTIGSIPTWSRNVVGNVLLSLMTGKSVLNPMNWPEIVKSIDIHVNKLGSHAATWENLTRDGFTETGFYKNDIPRALRKIIDPDDPNTVQKVIDFFLNPPRWLMDRAGELYNFGDSFFRVHGKLVNDRRGMSLDENLDDINMSYPNYRKLPKAVEFLQKVPLFGPFVSFRWNMGAIILRQSIQGAKEIKNPRTRGKGIRRLLMLTFFLMLPEILSELSKVTNNVDREDIAELEKYMPAWRRNGQFFYYRDKNGDLKVADLSYANPFGEFWRFGKAVVRGDIKGLTEGVDFFTWPLIDMFNIAINNRDPRFGIPYEDLGDRLTAFFQYFYLPASSPIPDIQNLLRGHFGPGAYKVDDPSMGYDYKATDPETGELSYYKVNEGEGHLRPGVFTGQQVKRIIDAYNNEPGEFGRIRDLPEELVSFFSGIRSTDVDPAVVLYNAYRERLFRAQELKDNYEKWVSKNVNAPREERDARLEELASKLKKIADELKPLGELTKRLQKTKFKVKERE